MLARKLRMPLAVIGMGMFLASCATDIKEIKDNITEYNGKKVTVSGTVIETTDLLVTKYYELKDDTESIYVVPLGDLPNEGDEKKVTGIVDEKMKVGKSNFIVIKEVAK